MLRNNQTIQSVSFILNIIYLCGFKNVPLLFLLQEMSSNLLLVHDDLLVVLQNSLLVWYSNATRSHKYDPNDIDLKDYRSSF